MYKDTCYHSHFSGRETEIWKDKITCPKRVRKKSQIQFHISLTPKTLLTDYSLLSLFKGETPFRVSEDL